MGVTFKPLPYIGEKMKNIFIKSFKTVLTVLPVSTTVLLSLYVKSGLGSVDWETIMRGTPGGK